MSSAVGTSTATGSGRASTTPLGASRSTTKPRCCQKAISSVNSSRAKSSAVWKPSSAAWSSAASTMAVAIPCRWKCGWTETRCQLTTPGRSVTGCSRIEPAGASSTVA